MITVNATPLRAAVKVIPILTTIAHIYHPFINNPNFSAIQYPIQLIPNPKYNKAMHKGQL
jgi:hypothetical protein